MPGLNRHEFVFVRDGKEIRGYYDTEEGDVFRFFEASRGIESEVMTLSFEEAARRAFLASWS